MKKISGSIIDTLLDKVATQEYLCKLTACNNNNNSLNDS